MAERKPCLRCQRQIDAYARLCPYCNWDQTDPAVPAPETVQLTEPAYVPPRGRGWRRYVGFGIGGVLTVILAFAVGVWINSDAAPKNAPRPVAEQQETTSQKPWNRADVTLVPVSDLEQPITSAPATNPATGVPTEYQRTDATAVSSEEYAQLAAKAKEEKRLNAALVDPRSIKGPAYSPAPPRREELPPPMTSAVPVPGEPPSNVITTRPVAISQPLPDIKLSQDATARLDLTVGPDGRVQEVNVRATIPGHTSELIAAVQRWRFKPATENGVPVAAPFSVELSFRAGE